MAQKFGVVRTDAVKATKDGNIKSGRFYNGAVEAAIENGMLVEVGGLLTGERELFKAVAPSAITAGNLYVVASPELNYDESLKENAALNKFINVAGSNITLIGLEVNDILSVSDECIDGSVEGIENKYLIPKTDGKWTVKADKAAAISASAVFYGRVIARELYKKDTYLNVIYMESVR